jgi:hypothetical protein
VPGRYYFCTWTTTPQEPLTKKHVYALRRHLQRERPLSSFIAVETNEGNGVIHLLIRLGKKEKRLDAKKEKEFWYHLTGADHVKFLPVKDKNGMANYMSNQTKMSVGREFLHQDQIMRWWWTKGWIPTGFTKAFGRVWHDWRDEESWVIKTVIETWLLACHEDPARIHHRPTKKEAVNRAAQGVKA